MDIETTKRLLMCGYELQDWQTNTAMAIIDLLQQESLSHAAICCALFDDETWQNEHTTIGRAREFTNDVKNILETLTKGGVIEPHFSAFRLKE